MSQGLDMTVNSLPSRTWNWLKMNEITMYITYTAYFHVYIS